ncbi:hypothetical protein V6N11_047728 [Hibiscus sabdariffa]|uniref:Uncharacterized protein n=2 Tax=Hibiscus sabdariffa TaxID=183260 RepID=A0ABR2BA58_9ROSI
MIKNFEPIGNELGYKRTMLGLRWEKREKRGVFPHGNAMDVPHTQHVKQFKEQQQLTWKPFNTQRRRTCKGKAKLPGKSKRQNMRKIAVESNEGL